MHRLERRRRRLGAHTQWHLGRVDGHLGLEWLQAACARFGLDPLCGARLEIRKRVARARGLDRALAGNARRLEREGEAGGLARGHDFSFGNLGAVWPFKVRVAARARARTAAEAIRAVYARGTICAVCAVCAVWAGQAGAGGLAGPRGCRRRRWLGRRLRISRVAQLREHLRGRPHIAH